MDNVTHISCSTSQYWVFLNILGRETQSLGGKAKEGSVQSLSFSSKARVWRSEMWAQRSILPCKLQCTPALHSTPCTPHLQPSPPHCSCTLGWMQTSPFHPQASFIVNTPLLRHLGTRRREGEPGFPPGFFSRAHSPSSEGREKRSTQAQYCRSQTLVLWALRTAVLAKYRTHHWQTEHPLKCLSLRLFLLLPVIFYTIQE